MTTRSEEHQAVKLVKWIIDKALKGIPPLSGAEDLALEYKLDLSYPDNKTRTDSLIIWETSKNFTSGFITGLGGIITLPAALPAALVASWGIQARMVGAIAVIYGHDLRDDRVQTLILLSIIGDNCKDVLKEAGIMLAQKTAQNLINKIPGKVLVEINKKAGFRLLTKAGTKGVVNLTKSIPVLGGVVGGTCEAITCRSVGYLAQQVFGGNDFPLKKILKEKSII